MPEPGGVGDVHRLAAGREPDPDRAAWKHDRSNAADARNLRRLRRPRRLRARQLRRTRGGRRRAPRRRCPRAGAPSRAPAAKPRASSHELIAAPMPRRRSAATTATPASSTAGPAAPSVTSRVGGGGRLAVELGERDGEPRRAEARRDPRPRVVRLAAEGLGVDGDDRLEVVRAGLAHGQALHRGRRRRSRRPQAHEPQVHDLAARAPRHPLGHAHPDARPRSA